MIALHERFGHIFEAELLKEIKEYGVPRNIKAGGSLITYGEKIMYMPLIMKGLVKIFSSDSEGKEILLYYVNSQESCAMTFTCCMQEKISQISAIAEEDVECIGIPVKYMDKWMTEYPTWKSFVMHSIQERFDEMLNTIDQIAFQKMDERLVNYLKQKSKVTNSLLINLSHEKIAQELGTSRVVISRLLKKLENDEKLLLYRHQIKLLKKL